MTIRRARPQDAGRLTDLAALDSARPLGGDVLLAEEDGALVAALDLDTRRAVADPMVPSASAVALLRLRALQLGAAPRVSRAQRLLHPRARAAGALR